MVDTRYRESHLLPNGWLLVIVLQHGLFSPRLRESFCCLGWIDAGEGPHKLRKNRLRSGKTLASITWTLS